MSERGLPLKRDGSCLHTHTLLPGASPYLFTDGVVPRASDDGNREAKPTFLIQSGRTLTRQLIYHGFGTHSGKFTLMTQQKAKAMHGWRAALFGRTCSV